MRWYVSIGAVLVAGALTASDVAGVAAPDARFRHEMRSADKAEPKVDVELVLAVDVSYSMDMDELAVQREGYAQAIVSKEFLQALKALPNGPRYFPEDQITDQPVRFMAAELIREHVLMQTHEEVPHAVSVLIEQFEESPRMTRIAAVIFCEREGQKAILLGKGGQMLKKIGTAARLDIEKMVGTKVYLELFVKIKAGWRDSRNFVEELDWRRQLQQIGGPPDSES